MPSRRLATHPLTPLERGDPVTIHHNGDPVPGFSNEPVAHALYANGRRVLARSMRYHRARGLYCGTGACTHCFVRHNGTPNARACQTPCTPHDWIEDQNAIPSVRYDALAAADLAFPNYLDAHRAFIRPRFLRPLYTWVLRRMAGFGRVPRTPVAQSYAWGKIQTDVCIVGSGPAGLAAADAAAEAGLQVHVLERAPRIGGRLRHLPTPFHATRPDAPRTEGKAWAAEARDRAEAQGATFHPSTQLFGIYPDQVLGAASPSRFLRLRAKALILAPGATDDYPAFPGSDRAGVLQATAALQLLNESGILPGENVAILGATRAGLLLARDLRACGASVAALLDPGPPRESDPLVADLRRLGVTVTWNARPTSIEGRTQPRGVRYENGGDHWVACDAVVVATGRHPNVELFQQAGCRLAYDPTLGGFHPVTDETLRTSQPNVWAAGSARGVRTEWTSALEGRVAGLAAARHLRPDDPDLARRLADAQAGLPARQTVPEVVA